MTKQSLTNKIIETLDGTVVVDHNLHHLETFNDTNLAQAIETHPPELLDICL